ncbi:MAG: sigma-54 dependent transcriptional regulator [Pseudomonadota bacterium]
MSDVHILVVEDDHDLADAVCSALQQAGHSVLHATDGEQALSLLTRNNVQLVLTDVQMQPMDGLSLLDAVRESFPGLPVILMTAYATVSSAVNAMQRGAETYLVKPFQAAQLCDTVEQCLARHRAISVTSVETGAVVCGDTTTMNLLAIAGRVAGSDATVLLSGESGTGKEVFARFVHNNSLRAEAPYVAINCAAIPENLLEATLFGHEKGAFTGATSAAAGKFEQANGGTLLLDEISEMELGLQAKLLRVLQERELERVGGKRSIALDVRVLATTNRNLEVAVRDGKFREDLYYRLNVFPLHIPPLRERRGDILPLFTHMLKRYCHGQRAVPKLTALAEKQLLQHAWPGNVRELENVVQRTLIMLQRNEIGRADLALELSASLSVASEQATVPAPNVVSLAGPQDSANTSLQEDLRVEERRLIVDALRTGAGNREAAARILGISPRTLRYKIARLRDAGYAVPKHLLRTAGSTTKAQKDAETAGVTSS